MEGRRIMSTLSIPRFSKEEYLKLERSAETRSEYLQGTVVAMSGASRKHTRIAAAVLYHLYAQLRDRPCEPAASDLRLYIEKHRVLTYPDVVVTCPPDVYLDSQKDTLADATLIVEVLSPSTQNYDRSEKFRYYRALPSFAQYLLLSQDAIQAELHTRQPDGSWLFREFNGPDAVLELTAINCTLPLGPLYERVDFEEQA